jgi:hypothetical protein
MNWSMPRPVLQVVATGLGVAWLGAFALAAFTAPPRGRLPGEGPRGASAEILQAQEATPLVDERIQGAAEPEELTPEEQAALDAEKKAKAEAAALAKAEAAKGAPAGPEAIIAPVAPPIVAKVEPAQPAAPPPKVEEPVF